MPSKGCILCRKRRIKCDEGKPGCNRCIKIGASCPGYERGLQLLFYDQEHGKWRKPAHNTINQGSSSNSPVPVDHPNPSSTSKPTPKSAPIAQRHNGQKVVLHRPERHLLDGQRISRQSTPMSTKSSSSDDTHVSQLQPCLTSDIDTRAICLFNASFIHESRMNYGSDSFLDFLPALYTASPSDSCLRYTLAAVAHLNFLNQYNAGVTLSECVARSYGEALRATNAALRNSTTASLDETLTSVWLLSMYELLAPGCLPIAIRHRTPWVNHVSGTLTMLRIRGKEQLQRRIGRQLFCLVQKPIVAMNMMMGEMPPEEIAMLSNEMLEADQEDMKGAALVSRFMQCAARVRSSLRTWIGVDQDVSSSRKNLSDLKEIIDEGLKVEDRNDFESWALENLEWRPGKTACPTIPALELSEYRTFFFTSTNVMQQWLTIWTTRMLLLQSLLNGFSVYKDVAEHSVPLVNLDERILSFIEAFPQDSVDEFQERLIDIANSIIGVVSFAFGEVDNEGVDKTRLSYSVYQSSSIGAYHMFWPLGALLASPYTTIKQKILAREALRSVGKRFHVVQALRYANY